MFNTSGNAIDTVDAIAEFEANVDRLFAKPDRDQKTLRQVHAVLGAGGEVGELSDAIKKSWIYNADLDLGNVKEEIGDTMFYLQALAAECGFSLLDAMKANVAKLKIRYPDGYTDQAAQDRADKNGVA